MKSKEFIEKIDYWFDSEDIKLVGKIREGEVDKDKNCTALFWDNHKKQMFLVRVDKVNTLTISASRRKELTEKFFDVLMNSRRLMYSDFVKSITRKEP